MNSSIQLLVVDDSTDMVDLLSRNLESAGFGCFKATAVSDAIDLLKEVDIDVLVTDLQMPGLDGMHLVKYAAEHFPHIPVLVITGYPSVTGAVEAIKSGAIDYLVKPFTEAELLNAIHQSLKRVQKKAKSAQKKEIRGSKQVGLIGQSEAIQPVLSLIERVKNTRVTTLIQGESGTGKELVARALHYGSRFSDRPFIAVNCGAIPENLLESELFGVVKGAFTGADVNRAGFFEAAHGGTLFLDEIGTASESVQTRLLRAIQEKQIRKVGATQTQSVDVRIIAATNTPLRTLCDNGSFRLDLYYRLNVIHIDLPPLRERLSDLPLLCEHLLKKYSKEFGIPAPKLSENIQAQLHTYSWPGNIRELENVVQRWILSGQQLIEDSLLPISEGQSTELQSEQSAPFLSLNAVEKQHISRVLAHVKGNKSKAARILGIDRKTLGRKLNND